MCLSVATTVSQNGKKMEEAGGRDCGLYRSTGKLRYKDKYDTLICENVVSSCPLRAFLLSVERERDEGRSQ